MSQTSKRSAKGAFGLSSDQVTSREIFDLETDRIFNREWVCVGRVSELDSQSQSLPIEIENHLLIVIRNDAGQLNCFHNICRHRGSQLVDEYNCSDVGKKLVCPYHAWSYDRDGELVSAPNMNEVDSFDRSKFGLRSVACREWEGFIWINIDGRKDFDTHMNEFSKRVAPWTMSELRTHMSIEYVVSANWKLIFQNYSECYHCPTVHPMLNRLTPYKASSNEIQAGPILGGPMSLADQAKTMSMDGKLAADVLPGLSEEQARTVSYFTLFPTMFISQHPDYVLTHRLERWSTDQTRVVCEFLFHPEALEKPSFSPDGAIEFWDMTNRQDWKVCELAQAGMSADGYVPGPYSNLESIVAAFDKHYTKVMSG